MLYAAATRSVRLVLQLDCVGLIHCFVLVAVAVMHLGMSHWFRVDNETNPDSLLKRTDSDQGTPHSHDGRVRMSIAFAKIECLYSLNSMSVCFFFIFFFFLC